MNTLGRDWAPAQKRLPQALTHAQCVALLGAVRSPVYRGLLAMMYGSGLRIGEAVKVQVHDVDKERMVIRVVGKGNKCASRGQVFSLEFSSCAFSQAYVLAPKLYLRSHLHEKLSFLDNCVPKFNLGTRKPVWGWGELRRSSGEYAVPGAGWAEYDDRER